MKILSQLCIKSYEVIDPDGSEWTAVQGKTYTTSVPDDNGMLTVFSNYWVPVPAEYFVIKDKEMRV